MGLLSRVSQWKYFWSAILFGPERAIGKMEYQEDYLARVNAIRAWLEEVSEVPGRDWVLVRSGKNPHSEVYIFAQVHDGKVPGCVFVKRFVVQLEGHSKVDVEAYAKESEALRALNDNLRDDGPVYVPRLFATNGETSTIATSYQDGVPFFNLLLKSPRSVLLRPGKRPHYQEELYRLGQWLKKLHGLGPMSWTHEGCPRGTAAKLLSETAEDIGERLEHLERVRPADFTNDFAGKIRAEVESACDAIEAPDADLVTTHGDFTIANIFYVSGRMCVLDYATLGPGFVEDDLARMYLDLHNIERWNLFLHPSRLGELSSAFGQGYGMQVGRLADARMRLFMIKHAMINLFMYTKHWGNRSFLHPVYCRIFYSFQRRMLRELVDRV